MPVIPTAPGPTYDELRHRIEREDELLNARIGIFLVVNGLSAVAMGTGCRLLGQVLLAAVSLSVNALWLVCSCKSRKVLKALAVDLLTRYPAHPVEKIVQEALGKCQLLRPTTILACHLPLIVTVSWLIALVVVLMWLRT